MLSADFDVSKIKFGAVKPNTMGGKTVYFKYGDQSTMNIQSPPMTTPFGISGFRDNKSGITKHTLDVSFRGIETDVSISEFCAKMKAFDDLIIKEAMKHSSEWFGKDMNEEMIKECYKPIIKLSSQPDKYASTMRCKVPSKDGRLMVEAYDHNKETFNLDKFVKGSKVVVQVECSSVWFVNKSFGVSWTLKKIKIQKPENLSGYGFQDSDDDME